MLSAIENRQIVKEAEKATETKREKSESGVSRETFKETLFRAMANQKGRKV